jgi:hypothetical protein
MIGRMLERASLMMLCGTLRPHLLSQAPPPAAQWRQLDVPPPSMPPSQEYRLLASVELPCSVYTFFATVIAQRTAFLQQQHELVSSNERGLGF